jgi:hypothetical protein
MKLDCYLFAFFCFYYAVQARLLPNIDGTTFIKQPIATVARQKSHLNTKQTASFLMRIFVFPAFFSS